MSKFTIITRLLLPCVLAGLLLLCLAYWWLDNLSHEVFGSVLFALLTWHIGVNRSWFKNLFRGRYGTRRAVALLLHIVLIANMALLLLTSVVISKSVFASLPIPDSIYLRDIHWFSAYWVMVIVGIHLGLHWTRVMNLTASSFQLTVAPMRTWWLRITAILLAGFGLWSFSVLGVVNKLTFTYSLEFWDFTASVALFFLHWAGVVAVPAIATHYVLTCWRLRRRAPAVHARRERAIEAEKSHRNVRNPS